MATTPYIMLETDLLHWANTCNKVTTTPVYQSNRSSLGGSNVTEWKDKIHEEYIHVTNTSDVIK